MNCCGVWARQSALCPTGLIAWLWYRRYLQDEATRYGESPEATTIRRIYYYAVAATALALLWAGLVEVLQRAAGWAAHRGALVSSEPIWANRWPPV